MIYSTLLLLLTSFTTHSFTITTPTSTKLSPLHSTAATTPTNADTTDTTAAASISASAAAATTTTTTTKIAKDPINVLLCPAQFCVPSDYSSLLSTLQSYPHIGSARVASLPRTEWIKVAKQLPTRAFWNANLDVRQTLDWYFGGIERALSEIYEETNGKGSVCLIGHSIGGWVARAYLGGLSESSTAIHRLTMERASSLITLGTPHVSPETAFVDQTRGLLRAIAEAESCSPEQLFKRGIDCTCVCSTAIESKLFSLDPDELIATASYFPLAGKLKSKGDGIVPYDLAFMDSPARRVEIDLEDEKVRHAHVVPTPWNLVNGYERSIELKGKYGVWYGSEGVLEQWAEYIQ